MASYADDLVQEHISSHCNLFASTAQGVKSLYICFRGLKRGHAVSVKGRTKPRIHAGQLFLMVAVHEAQEMKRCVIKCMTKCFIGRYAPFEKFRHQERASGIAHNRNGTRAQPRPCLKNTVEHQATTRTRHNTEKQKIRTKPRYLYIEFGHL